MIKHLFLITLPIAFPTFLVFMFSLYDLLICFLLSTPATEETRSFAGLLAAISGVCYLLVGAEYSFNKKERISAINSGFSIRRSTK